MREISARISTRSFASRFESGSSIRNACGLRTIARPIATRCRWPPDSVRGFLCSLSERPRTRAASLTRASISPCGSPRIFSGKPMFFADVHVRVERVVLEDHRDVAILRRQVVDDLAVDHAPCPEVIVSRPAIIRSAVVFPQPDGPTNTTNSPSTTARSSSVTACVPSAIDLRQALERDLGHVRLRVGNLLASAGSHGGSGCAVETGRTPLAARSREPPRPGAAPHRPCGHLHAARGRRPLRAGRSTSASPTPSAARSPATGSASTTSRTPGTTTTSAARSATR